MTEIALRILELYHRGLVPADMCLYILESCARAEAGLIGHRGYRDDNGVLRVNFENGEKVYHD